MALSLSGTGTPPLNWEGGSRGRRPSGRAPASSASWGGGEGGSSFLPELKIFPRPHPHPHPHLHPHPQRQIPVHPISSPHSRKKNHKSCLSPFLFAGAKGPRSPPSPIPALRRPASSPGDHQLVPAVCGGRVRLCVSAQVCIWCRWPDTCAWRACVCGSWCAPVRGVLCASGSPLVCRRVSAPPAFPWVDFSGNVYLGVCVRVPVHMSPRVGSSAQPPSPW